ncbi:MAG: type II secretion system F family protein [Candidatus Omnitrophica bacterium]|nr:type II secretion system F family protein [Candidatus Omnitrophota bacterium]
MPRFIYKAKEGLKKIVEGVIEADSKSLAVDKLTKSGLFPISVEEEPSEAQKIKRREIGFFKRIKTSDIALFTRQLSDLLDSGVNLLHALNVLEKQTESLQLKSVIKDLSNFVRDGGTFSEALIQHPKVFSTFFAHMIRAGETGGMLEMVLSRLSLFMEADEDLRARVKAALAYPVLMASVGCMTIVVLITFVIPKLVSLFADLGQELPVPTKLLIGTSNFFANFWPFLLIGIIILIFLYRRIDKTKEGKLAKDRFRLKIPVMGDLIKKSEIATFARTLGSLLNSGVPILDALEVIHNTATDAVLQNEIVTIKKSVSEGEPLAAALDASSYFPPFVTNMVAVGEKGGILEKSLYKVATAYEKETDKVIKVMTSLLEPILILVMGLIVGFIVIAMLLPIFQINLGVR